MDEEMQDTSQNGNAIWQSVIAAAVRSFASGNVGIGAVLTLPDGQTIVGENKSFGGDVDGFDGSPVAHAEIDALRQSPGRQAVGGRLYSSLQPCMMCSGACIMARLSHVAFLAPDPSWPTPQSMKELGANWLGTAIEFEQVKSSWASVALVLPLITFAERLPASDLKAFEARFPSHMSWAQDQAKIGKIRSWAVDGGTPAALADMLVGQVDPSEISLPA